MLKLVLVLAALASLQLASGLECYTCFEVTDSNCGQNATTVDTHSCPDNTACGTIQATTLGVNWTYRGCVPKNCKGIGTLSINGIPIDLDKEPCNTCKDSLCNSADIASFTVVLVLATHFLAT